LTEPNDPQVADAAVLKSLYGLLASDPAAALAQVRQQQRVGGSARLGLVEGLALRALGQPSEAIAVFSALTEQYAEFAPAWFELGRLWLSQARYRDAETALKRSVGIVFQQPEAHRLLGVCALWQQQAELAQQAFGDYRTLAHLDPEFKRIRQARADGQMAVVEAQLKARLKRAYDDPVALLMLAELALQAERFPQAVELLSHALKMLPDDVTLRHQLAFAYMQAQRFVEANEQIERCLLQDPQHLGYRLLSAGILASLGEYQAAKTRFERALQEDPKQAHGWLGLGHVLRTLGEFAECVAAYRQALVQNPRSGEAYFSLANLKTFRFEANELDAMLQLNQRTDLSVSERVYLEFALGKWYDDAGDYAQAFSFYQSANRQRKAWIPYSAEVHSRLTQRLKAFYPVMPRAPLGVASAQVGLNAAAGGVIFIVGLPRAGSTLLEQILASHSAIEGTMELPILPRLVRELLGDKDLEEAPRYPQLLAEFTPADCARLGERYLSLAARYRHTTRPWFIDKMPNNFTHIGLISHILPTAKIIDMRRHPMACCWANFKQHFARGQNFTYDLGDLARYYRDYVELMAHFDASFLGRVERVIYEDLVAEPEAEIRRLLAALGLGFEPACLEFHRNKRAVRTASAQQVREPLNRKGLDQWQHYAPYLGELKQGLGDLLEATAPDAPPPRWRG
jgi:tetratricopeptide (TPR) repeat protein